MPSYHATLCKNPYRNFGSAAMAEVNRIRCYLHSFNKVLDRANQMGLKPNREQALRLGEKYCRRFSGNATHSFNKFAQYIGYGFYQNGKWDVDGYEMDLDLLSIYYATRLSDKAVIGSFYESLSACVSEIDKQCEYLANYEPESYTEVFVCPCGQHHKGNFKVGVKNLSYTKYCNTCFEKALEIDAEIEETAEVKRLLNKLKKVIKNENKKSTL